MPPLSSLTFEDSLKKLEDIVASLEKGQLPLKKAVDVFDEGMLLIKHCEAELREAELRISEIRLSYTPEPEVPKDAA